MLKIDHSQPMPDRKMLSSLNTPLFLMNLPLYINNEVQNNVWVVENPDKINVPRAINQWLNVYQTLASMGIVYLLPSQNGLQDQVYVANLGALIPDTVEKNTMILANFRSTPRVGEDDFGREFFASMEFNVLQPPFFFEGEADLKYIRDNIMIGGYGIRTDLNTYKWIKRLFPDITIYAIEMTDEYLYHFDCLFFPVDPENAIVCTEILSPQDVRKIEKIVNIIPVDKDVAYQGIANSVRCQNTILTHSSLSTMKRDDEQYIHEKKKLEILQKTGSNLGMEILPLNISEFLLSGALMSCMVQHLNYHDFKANLV